MAKCIAQALSSDGGQERAERLLDLSPAAARTFLRWGAPEETTADRVAEDGSHPIDPRRAAQLRKVALEHYRAQRFATAAQAYEEAVRFSPQDARSYSGAGAARFALGDVQAAIEAYHQAVRLEPRHAGYHAALGRALTAAGNLRAAAASLQHALSIDPNHRSARQGLAYLDAMRNQGSRSHRSAARPASRSAQQVARGRAAPAPRPARAHSGLPLAPSREAVITTMRPLKDAVAGCAPGHEGVVPFMLTIAGETGQVTDVEVDGDLAGTDESRCMEGVVRSASFPRFQKSQLEIRYPFEL
jgi:tetratricopeptide (TPR) repeat protein